MKADTQVSMLFSLLMALDGTQGVVFANELVAPRYATDQITLKEWQAYLAEVKSIADIQCRDSGPMQHVCDSASRRTIWVFTRAGHPAHPAVSRGVLVSQPVSEGTKLGIDRTGHYVGDPKAFAEWMIELLDSDHRNVAAWGRDQRLQ